MPEKGVSQRAATISYLSGLLHEQFVALDKDGLLRKLNRKLDAKEIRGKDAVIVREVFRVYEREKKLPKAFVSELALLTAEAQSVWAEARTQHNFSLFLPWLRKIVALKRKEAELVSYKDSPYDALLDTYEPDVTTEEASKVLNDLKDFLIPFLKAIKSKNHKSNSSKVKGTFPLYAQSTFNNFVAEQLWLDMAAGRLDISVHPFTTNFHPEDVRITTRFREDDVLYGLGSTIH